MIRALAAATVVALACALSTPHPPRPTPDWYDEACAEVQTVC